MRFKVNGQFETETIIDIAQRLTAQLQDAGVERVAGVSIYLSVFDRKGASRTLTLDGDEVDTMTLNCGDLALKTPQPQLEVGRPSRSTMQRQPKKRRTR